MGRKTLLSIFALTFALLTILSAGCSTGPSEDSPPIKNEIVTAENSQQLAQEAQEELSFNDYQLLQDYVDRVHPDVPEGQLPVGITVGTMIESQKAYESAQQPEASAGEGETTTGDQLAESKPTRSGSTPGAPAAVAPASDSADETASAPQTASSVASEPEPTAPPEATTATLPRGTDLKVRLAESVSSKTAQPGDSFEAILDEALQADGKLVAPAGSRVVGRITDVESSGKVQGRAQMALTLSRVFVDDEVYALPTNTLRFEAEGTKKDDAKKIGIASGIGAVIGAIAGGGKGAAIGAGVGAGAGTGVVLATSGEEVEFRSEQLFNFKLDREVEFPLRD